MGNGPDGAATVQESSTACGLMRRRSYFSALVLLAINLLLPVSAMAANPAPSQAAASNGLSLTPAIQDQVLSPKQTSVSFPVQLFNHTSQPVTLSISTIDFTALNQSGGIAFEGGSVSAKTQAHGLSSFLQLSAQTLTLAPNTAQTVTASIKDVSKLAVGGHYGAVLAQTISPPSGSGANHVAIHQVLSSLLFLQTAGQGTRSISLLKPAPTGLSFHLPSSLNLVFASTGNTQAVPRGTVSVSRGNTSYEQAIINENSSLVLPDSTRLFQTQLHGNDRPWWPGRYQIEVQYRYDVSLGITTYRQSFIYINLLSLLLMLVALIVLIFIASRLLRMSRLWQRLRAFNDRTAAAMPLPVAPLELPSQPAEPDVQTAEPMPDEEPPDDTNTGSETVARTPDSAPIIEPAAPSEITEVPPAQYLAETIAEAPLAEPEETSEAAAKTITKIVISEAIESVEPKKPARKTPAKRSTAKPAKAAKTTKPTKAKSKAAAAKPIAKKPRKPKTS